MNFCRALTVCCLLACLGGQPLCLSLFAGESPETTTESIVPAEEPQPVTGPQTTTNNEAREEEKQRKAMAGLLALCGILIGGLMFVVFVMVWGARLRRMARRELPPQTTLHNEHWYLKPPKESRETKVESPEPDKSEDRNAGS